MRLSRWLLYAWVGVAVIQALNMVATEHYHHVVSVAPRAAQGASGDVYAQSLIKIQRSLPPHDPVLVVWRRSKVADPQVDFWYGFFWGSYWLYPRQVDILTAAPAPADVQSHSTIIDVRDRAQEALPAPDGYAVWHSYQDHWSVVTVLRRTT